MKRLNILNIGIFLLVGLIYFTSCKDEFTTEYTRYEPIPVSNSNVNLVYSPLVAYPELAVLKTDTPTFVIDGAYSFRLDTITSTVENGFVLSNFSIGQEHGVVSYDNKKATLLPGKYSVSVSISNVTGIAIFDQASEIEILDVPVTLTADNPTVEAGALQQGVLATVSYTDDSPNQLITSVAYSLVTEVPGFSINSSTGEISKTTEAESGVNELSIFAETNLGGKEFAALVTVTVGPSPTLEYTQIDGVSLLTEVTLSPWTAYTTQMPTLNDMVATQWDVIVPSGLDAGAISIGADGSFSVLAGQNVAVGDYSIGVEVTNASGASFEFPDLFILHFETRWDAVSAFYEDFNNTTTTPEEVNIYNPALASYIVNGGGIELFKAVKTENIAKDRMFQSAKMRDAKNDIQMQAVLILSLTIDQSWYNMRVSFNELFGYGTNRLDWWERTLGFGYDNSGVAGGTYNPANWNILMEPTNSDWSGSSGTVDGAKDTDMNQIPMKDFGGLDNTQSTVFINWFYGETAAANGTTQIGAEFHVDNIKVEVSRAFTAIEE